MAVGRRISNTGGSRHKKADGGRRRVTTDDSKLLRTVAGNKSSASIVLPEIRKVLMAERTAGKSRIYSSSIYPSEMARADWCIRATYYRVSGMAEPESNVSFSLENVFSEGNRIHSKWQGWMAKTGDLWGDWFCANCQVRYNNCLMPGRNYEPYLDTRSGISCHHEWEYKEVTLKSSAHRISGHADGALLSKNCLVEIKSAGLGTFRFDAPNLVKENTYTISGKSIIDTEGIWKNLHRPLLAYVRQGNIYLYMAQEMGMPFDTMVFIIESKMNQQVKEFSIKISSGILSPMLDKAAEIEYALERGTPPACPFGGCAKCRAYEGA
jgi:hypothetical protein